MWQPGRSNVAPVLWISWDTDAVGLSYEDVTKQLSEGDPRIEMFAHKEAVSVMPYMMERDEEVVVARRLKEVLAGGGG